MWKTLCPFWGEEYQVHLPPTFHAVAFYVMDEDALRWVGPNLQMGPQPCQLTPRPMSLPGLWVALHPLCGLERGWGGALGGSGRARGLSELGSAGAGVFTPLTPHPPRAHAGVKAQVCWAVRGGVRAREPRTNLAYM